MTFASDCRLAWRSLRRSPAFVTTAVLTLALGIGANTAIFSVVDGVLFKPLPYPNPDELVAIAELPPSGQRNTVSATSFLTWQTSATAFSGIAARQSVTVALLEGAVPEEMRAARVSPSYFDVLSVPAAVGRGFAAADGDPGAPCVVILSDRLWARRWAREPGVVGRSIPINDQSCEVVGVLPANSVFDRVPYQLYLPMRMTLANAPRGHFLTVVGRLRAEVTLAQAQAEIERLANTLARETPGKAGWSAIVDPWRATIVRADSRQLVLILFGAVAVVLVVACVNVASLGLSRASARRREVSIRLALGAGAGRLFSHYVAESLLLAIGGAVVGLGVGAFSLAAFTAVMPPGTLPTEAPIALDGRVLLFTVALVAVVSLLFGSVPAWQSLRGKAADALRSEGRGATASSFTRRMQNALLVAQVALAMMLVTGAAMLAVSFVRLSQVNPGFNSNGVMTFRLSLPNASPTPEAAVRFHETAIAALQSHPAVAWAGAATSLPLRGWLFGTTVRVDGIALANPAQANAHVQHVAGDYFAALGIPLAGGRALNAGDRAGSALAVVVNETFVRRFIGTGPAVGRRVYLGVNDSGTGSPAPWEIVGVARDVKTGGLADAELRTPEVYVSHAQAPMPVLSYAVRAKSDGAPLEAVVRDVIRGVHPTVPLSALMTMDDLIGDSVAGQRFRTALVTSFAGVTLIVAVIGVYAVRAQAVAVRRREVGIRMALGATRRQVSSLMVTQGARLLLAGLVLGLVGARLAARAIDAWLFKVSTSDLMPMAIAAAALGGATLIASWVPARRAARVEPLETLRQD